jgi:hypothetical protein
MDGSMTSVASQEYLPQLGTCPRPFASDIEHFGSQTPGERSVKNHKLFEGLKAFPKCSRSESNGFGLGVPYYSDFETASTIFFFELFIFY